MDMNYSKQETHVTSNLLSNRAGKGLLFKCLAQINSKTKTPIIATLSSGAVAGERGVTFIKKMGDL